MAEQYRPRILLVDDDVLMLELLSMILDMAGYETVTASDGSKAMDVLLAQKSGGQIDVIMVDLMMPVMDGLRFMRWLREEARSSLPVLALTGKHAPNTEREALGAGANCVMFKPVDPDKIVAKLAELLRARA